MDLRSAKSLVWTFNEQLLAAAPDAQMAVAEKYCAADLIWRGPHPLNERHGPLGLIDAFHGPLAASIPDLSRRNDISFAGTFNDAVWVTSTGYYRGHFAADWLGIPASGQPVDIRFGEFVRVGTQGIEETCVMLDLPDLMRQVGIAVLPPSLGTAGIVPVPLAGDGVILNPQDEKAGALTCRLVADMIAGLMKYDGRNLASMGMERFWHPDMLWYGPCGIGTTYGLDGFQRNHQGPFLASFPDRTGGRYTSHVVEGRYLGIVGWPSVTATHVGPYLGASATNRRITMRVMDWWAREGELLRENWVLIDLVDLFLQFGVDLFERMREQRNATDVSSGGRASSSARAT
jgi:hypothetical protein